MIVGEGLNEALPRGGGPLSRGEINLNLRRVGPRIVGRYVRDRLLTPLVQYLIEDLFGDVDG